MNAQRLKPRLKRCSNFLVRGGTTLLPIGCVFFLALASYDTLYRYSEWAARGFIPFLNHGEDSILQATTGWASILSMAYLGLRFKKDMTRLTWPLILSTAVLIQLVAYVYLLDNGGISLDCSFYDNCNGIGIARHQSLTREEFLSRWPLGE